MSFTRILQKKAKRVNVDKAITKAHLNAKGWDMGDFHQSNPFDCHVFYLFDFRLNTIQLISLPKKEFNKLSHALDDQPIGEIVYEVNNLSYTLIKKTLMITLICWHLHFRVI